MSALPSYIDPDTWAAFIEMRKAIPKVPYTLAAQKLGIKKLMQLHDDGHDAQKCLETSLENGWRTFFAPKADARGQSTAPNRQEAQEQRNMQGAMEWAAGGHDARH